LEDGTVACWGLNTDGQLGDNSTTDRDTPTLTIPLGAPAIAIESDHTFTCAILNNGSVMCWGANAYGQIGSVSSGGDLLKPTHVANMPGTTVSVSTGVDHSCTLLSNNSVNCLGRNNVNQHGNGTTGGSSAYTSPFALNQTKLMLDGGGDATCALIDNGSMYCWGRNAQGNIGDGTTNTASTPTLVDTSYKFLTRSMDKVNSATNCSTSPGLPNGLFIDNNTCTISGTPTDASVNQTYTVTANISNITFQTSVWLSASYLELTSTADGAELSVDIPMTNITFGTSSASSDSLALGYNHACGILNNGSIKCWGSSGNDRLGNGATQPIGDGAGEMGDALPVSNLGTGRTAILIFFGLT
jgi:alpha-tubulin suppressor-like RCC1 family protein